MALQFRCPCEQANLLEADESLIGQAIQCPFCEMQFVVPSPVPAAAAPVGPAPSPAFDFDAPRRQPAAPSSGPANAAAQRGAARNSGSAWQGTPGQSPASTGAVAPNAASEASQLLPGEMPGVVHLACPHGHELETPRELLGSDVACPVCGVEFRLRREDTAEYRVEKRAERERKELQFGNKMMNFAIVTAVLVVLAIVLMALYIGLG